MSNHKDDIFGDIFDDAIKELAMEGIIVIMSLVRKNTHSPTNN